MMSDSPSKIEEESIEKIEDEIYALNKKLWKGVHCELQYVYGDFVIWINMYKKEDVFNCYREMRNIFEEYLENISKINICIYFYVKYIDDIYHQYTFSTTDEFLSGCTYDGPLSIDKYDEVSSDMIFDR